MSSFFKSKENIFEQGKNNGVKEKLHYLIIRPVVTFVSLSLVSLFDRKISYVTFCTDLINFSCITNQHIVARKSQALWATTPRDF